MTTEAEREALKSSLKAEIMEELGEELERGMIHQLWEALGKIERTVAQWDREDRWMGILEKALDRR